MRPLVACALVACLVAAACGGSSPTATPIPQPTAAPPSETVPAGTPTTAPGETPPLTATAGATSGTSLPTPIPATLESASERPSISITSNTTEVRPGEVFRVDVILDPQGKGISGVQVKIAYDPAALRPTDAVAGPLLGEESIEIPLIIDEVAGFVEYVAARIGSTAAPTPPGLVATIRFQALETAVEGTLTSLTITGVQVPDENIQEITGILVGEGINISIVTLSLR